MLTIGEFSRICKVTTRTLRHYDEIDLIKPVKINEENNYRYYDVNQARTVMKGNYSRLSEGYAKIIEWITDNNYKINGAPYEKYINGPMDSGEIITEIYMPVE